MGTGGNVIWITGLSASGKSTLAGETVRLLRARGATVVSLDGDELRQLFDLGLAHGHDPGSRLALARAYGRLCLMLASQGVTVVIATIALFHEVHAWNRKHLPGYFEVFLDVPLEELRRRDPKGLYRRFDAGDASDVAGLDLAVEEPLSPDWRIGFDPSRSPAALAGELLRRIALEHGR